MTDRSTTHERLTDLVGTALRSTGASSEGGLDPSRTFTQNGGTSIAAVQLAAAIHEEFAVSVDAIDIVIAPSVTYILELVEQRNSARTATP